MSLPRPQLGDLAQFLAGLALGAMGKMDIPGESVPVDRARARWFIDLLEEVSHNLSDETDPKQRQVVDQVLAQLRMAFVEDA